MKKLLLSAALLACTAQLKAQDSYLGLKAAWNYSTNTFNDPALSNGFEVNHKSGFAGGLYYNVAFTKKFSMQAELMYSQMGSKLTQSLDNVDYKTTLELDYITIPILFKYTPSPKLGVFIGPEFYFTNAVNADIENTGNINQWDQINGTDVAGTIGAEYWITRNIGIYGRYIYGFTNISKQNPGVNATNGTFITSDIHNMGWQFGITIGFKSKAETPVTAAPTPAPAPAPAPVPPPPPAPVKSVDSDGDGVPDASDKCPNVSGLAKYQGCPIPDTDGDGINDEMDKCPKVAGIAANLGCPELTVYFKRAEAGLTSEDMASLDSVVTFMNRNPSLNVIVEGYTSTLGEEAFNQTLSEKRANECVDYLVSKGIDKSRLTAVGFGERFPIGDNNTEEGRALSRRAVMRINTK